MGCFAAVGDVVLAGVFCVEGVVACRS